MNRAIHFNGQFTNNSSNRGISIDMLGNKNSSEAEAPRLLVENMQPRRQAQQGAAERARDNWRSFIQYLYVQWDNTGMQSFQIFMDMAMLYISEMDDEDEVDDDRDVEDFFRDFRRGRHHVTMWPRNLDHGAGVDTARRLLNGAQANLTAWNPDVTFSEWLSQFVATTNAHLIDVWYDEFCHNQIWEQVRSMEEGRRVSIYNDHELAFLQQYPELAQGVRLPARTPAPAPMPAPIPAPMIPAPIVEAIPAPTPAPIPAMNPAPIVEAIVVAILEYGVDAPDVPLLENMITRQHHQQPDRGYVAPDGGNTSMRTLLDRGYVAPDGGNTSNNRLEATWPQMRTLLNVTTEGGVERRPRGRPRGRPPGRGRGRRGRRRF